MVDRLSRNWWMLAIRGVAAVLFGVLAFLWPGSAMTALVFLFGAYALIDGVVAIVAAVHRAEVHERWGGMLFEGILGLLAGIAAFVIPGLTTIALVYVIGFWALLTGVAEIAAAVRLRREIEGEWMLGVLGVLSVLFGILLVASPLAGAVVVVWWIAAYALVFGLGMVALAIRLRSHAAPMHRPRATA